MPGGGPVPTRPALAVKIDNYPAARPQSGLDKADVVFEEPVEGGITRYAAVFQCQDAPLVGPVRSARNIDIGILGQLGTPLLVHVGGIDPVLANIEASPLVNVDLRQLRLHRSRIPAGRVAPYATYSSTAQLWGTHPTHDHAAPAALHLFDQGAHGDAGLQRDHRLLRDLRRDVEVQPRPRQTSCATTTAPPPTCWPTACRTAPPTWSCSTCRSATGPGSRTARAGWRCRPTSTRTPAAPAEVFRGGTEITGTWSRSSLGSPTQFLSRQRGPDPAAARSDLGGAGAQHHHGHDDSLRRPPGREALRADHPREGRGRPGATSMLRARSGRGPTSSGRW